MRTRLWVAVGLVGVATTVGGAVAVQSASAITRPVTINLVAPDTERRTVLAGPRGTAPHLGDRLIFAGPVTNPAGTRVRGRIDGVCTTTSNPTGPDQQRQLCTITVTLNDRNGSEVQMQGVGRVLAEDVVFSVTGGSGAFQNVRGESTFDFRTRGRAVLQLRLFP